MATVRRARPDITSTDPVVIECERRRFADRRLRGRPALVHGQRSVSLTVSVPVDLYDRLVREAALQRCDLAPYIRGLLISQLKNSVQPSCGSS